MCIGQAGENLVPAAMLVNDYNHSVSHSAGGIFGSKKLKAIVVRGSARPKLHDRVKLIETGLRWRKTLNQRTAESKTGVGHSEHLEALPNNNFQSTIIADHNRGFDQNQIRLKPCFNASRCVRGMLRSRKALMRHGRPFQCRQRMVGYVLHLGIKGNAVLYLAERINDLGIECSHFSFGVSVAFEAWEKGLLDASKTDGMRLSGAMSKSSTGSSICARGARDVGGNSSPKARSKSLNISAVMPPNGSVHTKKGTPALHDWRPHFGQMLKEIVASGGMKPQGGATGNPPPDLRYREKWGPLDREDPKGWAWSQIVNEQLRQFCGLFGACWFAQSHMRPDGLKSMVDSLNATTGWDFTLDEALLAGHRAMVLQSVFGHSAAGSRIMTGLTWGHASSPPFRMGNTKASPSPDTCRRW